MSTNIMNIEKNNIMTQYSSRLIMYFITISLRFLPKKAIFFRRLDLAANFAARSTPFSKARQSEDRFAANLDD